MERAKRTSGAKALIGHSFFGTAKAVPFVKSPFPICLKALTMVVFVAAKKHAGLDPVRHVTLLTLLPGL
jgi:hypothetical protein